MSRKMKIGCIGLIALTNHVIGGHTLKHLAVAVGILLLLPNISPATHEDDLQYLPNYS